MNIINNGLYRFLDKVTDIILLNILWVIASIPIFTLFPATAGMYCVVRDWVQGKRKGVIKSYFYHFRRNFKQSLIIGFFWVLLGISIYININMSIQMEGIFLITMMFLILFACILLVITTVYLFPVLAHFRAKWFNIVKNSLLISISHFGTTIVCVIILMIACFLSYIIPISFLFIWSLTAFAIYSLCHRVFQNIESMLLDKT